LIGGLEKSEVAKVEEVVMEVEGKVVKVEMKALHV
jgi:hypothetical protein